MSPIVSFNEEEYRLLVAIGYLNASNAIFNGLQRQRGVNDFHFLITLRSFIEYTRRGIWFLIWANEDALRKAETLTFDRPGSPKLEKMDAMINGALGKGEMSHLMDKVIGIDEPFINCLHALTHGNPISVRMISFGLDKVFDTKGLLDRAELELNLFRTIVYRRALSADIDAIWKLLTPIHDRPADMKANALIAADLLKKSGKIDAWMTSIP